MPEGILTSISEAHSWLIDSGYDITERSVLNHVRDGKLPAEKSRNNKVKAIRLIDLERYAKNHLQKISGTDDDRDQLRKEQIRKLQLENDAKEGKFLNREEEEQRDAAILAGFRRHLEASAPDRLQGIIAEILKLIDDGNIRAAIVARQPAWLERDMDQLADIFDGFEGV